MASVNVRIDDQVKHNAERVLNSIGLSMSNAISIYFKQIALKQEIPFRLTANPLELIPSDKLTKMVDETKSDIKSNRNVSKVMNKQQTVNHLKKLRSERV